MKLFSKREKKKDPYLYRELYLKEDLAQKLDAIAVENESSFNSVVIGMLEACIEQLEQPEDFFRAEETSQGS